MIKLEEDLVPDVRALKKHLNQLQDLPPRFRQRLLLNGQFLEDTFPVRAGMELELVVLSFITNRSPHEVQKFTAAAGAGHFHEARTLNKPPLRTRHAELIVQREGLMFRRSTSTQGSLTSG